jgi:predicted  nucleic acid-binding Zn-ribbon protein
VIASTEKGRLAALPVPYDICSTGVNRNMAPEIVRKLTPEEEELLRKREELASVRAALAERELDLADFRAQLKSFEGRYLRQVGVLYAELDDWEAKIAELEASLMPSATASRRAQETRKQAEETHEATHGEASKAKDFQPSADLKSLFREAAKRIHPDFAKDEADREFRTRLMAKVNDAYGQGDTDALQRILDEFGNSPESVQGEGVGAELVRIIRQIHQARKNIAAIENELSSLRASEIALLKQDAGAAQQESRDLLAELAAGVHKRIADAKKKHETLTVELKKHGR